jgi:hypothetical protein
MDEREDLQNIEDNIIAENIDSSIEEQAKAPPIEIEELKEQPAIPEYSEFPVEPLPEGLSYKAPKKEAPKKDNRYSKRTSSNTQQMVFMY